MISQQYTRWFYYTGLLGIIAGMSISKPGISIGISICLLAWLLEPNLWERIKSLKAQPFFWISLALMLLHLVGLLWSQNLAYGFKDVKTKLPLLLIPIVFLSSNSFRLKNELFFVKLIFIASLVVCTLFSFGIYFHWIKPQQFNSHDLRTMIFGVSGVRLALFICLALIFLTYDVYYQKKWGIKLLLLALMCWFLFFLNFIESGTAVVFIIILSLYTVVYFVMTKLSRIKQLIILCVGVIILVSFAFILNNFLTSMFVEKPDPITATNTKHGEPYVDDANLPFVENGYVVGDNLALNELTNAWNKRSAIKMGEKDKLGQPIFATLMRYLNSKGGIKDGEAVEKLTSKDIDNIEKGVANYNYQFIYGWQKRLIQIIFEFEVYRNGSNPFGNSVTQRFEYWKIAINLFKANVWLGIGTGDVKDAYENAYRNYATYVDPRFKLRAHNQYLTMAVTFGIVGLIVFLIYALSLLWTKAFKEYRYFTLAFLIIMLFSFLSEDTLETQSGVTFIVFFHTLFNLRTKIEH